MYAFTSALCITLAASECQSGQGDSSGHFILAMSANNQADCDANCLARPSCKYYDYTTARKGSIADPGDGSFLPSCRLFTSEDGSIADPGFQNREICEVRTNVQYPMSYQSYSCSVGQGPDRGTLRFYQAASEVQCAYECKNDDQCNFFDYTSRSQQENCRWYASSSGSTQDPGPYFRVACTFSADLVKAEPVEQPEHPPVDLEVESALCKDPNGQYTCAEVCCFGDDGHIHSPFCCSHAAPVCDFVSGTCRSKDGLHFMDAMAAVRAEPEVAVRVEQPEHPPADLEVESALCKDPNGQYTCSEVCCFGDDGHIHSPFCCSHAAPVCNFAAGTCSSMDGLLFMQGMAPVGQPVMI